VEIREIDRSDEDQLRQFWLVGKQAEDAYRPYDFYPPFESARAAYVEGGRPGFRNQLLGAFVGDRLVGRTYLNLPTLDNTHLCFFDLQVHPEHQRRGIGTALVDAVVGAARAEGRRTVVAEAYVPSGSDGPALAFSRATGFSEAIDEGIKIVDLVETEPTWEMLAKEAAARSEGYRLVAWDDAVPADLMDEFCRLNEAFNDEAPSGELELEAEVWDEARVRAGEAQNRKVGRHMFAVAAIAPDGAMAGLTEAMVSDHAPTRGFQSGTLVLPEHRGHALGLAMKVANHQAIRAAFPQCQILMTGNAGVNAAMNAVNERLGYREVERCVEVQRDV
jgi:GNAT superfamily N-acetyltransferase